MQKQNSDHAAGVPLNVKLSGPAMSPGDAMQHVPRANTKILYEDPLERKRRERELRIS